MEADWSVEIGPGLPRLDLTWNGFVDLRSSRQAVDRLPEVMQLPALRPALLALNAETSRVFTSKCDVWELAKDEIDPFEFAASSEAVHAGIASYIDTVHRDPAVIESFAFHEQWVRNLTTRCRSLDLPRGRVDVVIRSAITNHQPAYGLTIYAAGCGANEAAALNSWQAILAAVVAATIAGATGE